MMASPPHKHNSHKASGPSRPLFFFIIRGEHKKLLSTSELQIKIYRGGLGGRRLPDGNIHFRAFVSVQHTLLMGSVSLSLPLFRTEVKLRVRIHISVEDNEAGEN